MSRDSLHSNCRSFTQTKSVWTWLVALVSLSIALSSCAALGFGRPRQPEQPPREICNVGEQGCACFDPRRPKGEQSYMLTFEECRNYVATNPVDYDGSQEWIRANCFGPRKPKTQ